MKPKLPRVPIPKPTKVFKVKKEALKIKEAEKEINERT